MSFPKKMTMSSASPYKNRGKDVCNLDKQQQQQQQLNEYSPSDESRNLSSLSPPMVSERKRRANKLTKYRKELLNIHRPSPFKPQQAQNRRNIPAFLNKLFK
jgi:hypothetical protein